MSVQTSQIHQLQSEQRRLQEELVQVSEALEQERATVKQLDGELVTVNLVKQGMNSEIEKVCVCTLFAQPQQLCYVSEVKTNPHSLSLSLSLCSISHSIGSWPGLSNLTLEQQKFSQGSLQRKPFSSRLTSLPDMRSECVYICACMLTCYMSHPPLFSRPHRRRLWLNGSLQCILSSGS